jgi:hypothetical protein
MLDHICAEILSGPHNTEPGHDSQQSISCKAEIRGERHPSLISVPSHAESPSIKSELSAHDYLLLEHSHPSSRGVGSDHSPVKTEQDDEVDTPSSLCVNLVGDNGNIKIEKREEGGSELSIPVRIEKIKVCS